MTADNDTEWLLLKVFQLEPEDKEIEVMDSPVVVDNEGAVLFDLSQWQWSKTDSGRDEITVSLPVVGAADVRVLAEIEPWVHTLRLGGWSGPVLRVEYGFLEVKVTANRRGWELLEERKRG